jgi:hypothetical protein
MAEGGPLPPVDRDLIAQHERRLALAFPRAGTVRVLSVVEDGGTWHVDLDVVPVEDETFDPADPDAVRVHIETEQGAARADLPVEVLQRIAERIREL